jgi:hypothetical protein
VKGFWIDLLLWILASPVLFVKWLWSLRRRWKFWQMAYTPRIVCTSCRGTIWLVGQWQCTACAYTYQGHLLRECPVCGSLPRFARCFNCGVTTKLPEP